MGWAEGNTILDSTDETIARIEDAVRSIPDLIRDPAANSSQAVIVLGIAVVLVLIVLVTVALMLVRPRPYAEVEPGWVLPADTASRPRRRRRRTPLQRAAAGATGVAVTVVMLTLMLLAIGIGAASSSACMSCHDRTVHSVSSASDPHRAVACVDCHEPGGMVARTVLNVPVRLRHYYTSEFRPAADAGYGASISSVNCRRCHQSEISEVRLDAERGIRVSHKEPLAAGAECVDCHRPDDGQVNARTVRMVECMRCHDGKQAKHDCPVCHTQDPAVAIAAQTPEAELASELVLQPKCDSCHTDTTRCDNCHGVSMPHTAEFMAYGHAMAGARSIWDDGGKACNRCHYAGHRACTQEGCHTYAFPQHAETWMTDHQQAEWANADGICRCHNWDSRQHQGMNFCQTCHPAKPPGTR